MIKFCPNGNGGITHWMTMELFRDIYGHISEEFWFITQTGEVILQKVAAVTKLTASETLKFIQEKFFPNTI
jgi:hypothetical protein